MREFVGDVSIPGRRFRQPANAWAGVYRSLLRSKTELGGPRPFSDGELRSTEWAARQRKPTAPFRYGQKNLHFPDRCGELRILADGSRLQIAKCKSPNGERVQNTIMIMRTTGGPPSTSVRRHTVTMPGNIDDYRCPRRNIVP